jgi:glycosyltransferase involved in cell wall biosynthesis
MARSRTEISVVIATYNRAELLAGALHSLAEQTLDPLQFEIVVVDNGSTDETPGVVSEFQLGHAKLHTKLISEKRPGLGRARNTGDEHAEGRLIAFLDDDARAAQDWLEKALRCFEEISPTPLAVGGLIRPFYLAPKPDWFKDEYETRSWGSEPRFLSRGETFSGSNMIFIKEVLRDHGSFSERFGMEGERLSVGEETALFDEIWRRNPEALLYYAPDLVVRHAVPAGKMTVSYILKRALVEGQAWYGLHSAGSALGRVRYVVSEAIPGLFRSLATSPFHLRRYEHVQNWLVEDSSVAISRLGGLLACLGIELKFGRSR